MFCGVYNTDALVKKRCAEKYNRHRIPSEEHHHLKMES